MSVLHTAVAMHSWLNQVLHSTSRHVGTATCSYPLTCICMASLTLVGSMMSLISYRMQRIPHASAAWLMASGENKQISSCVCGGVQGCVRVLECLFFFFQSFESLSNKVVIISRYTCSNLSCKYQNHKL